MPVLRRRALIIGINYTGTPAQLGGCVNDARLMTEALGKLGFQGGDVEVLTDAPGGGRPTRANIEAACRRLVDGATEGDSLFFHYSGHGGRSVNLSGAERTGYDSTLIPLDHATAGQITDDELNELLVEPASSAGARLTCVVDACHSGTVLDLPFLCQGADAQGQWLWTTEDARTMAVTERTGSIRAMLAALCMAPKHAITAKPPEDSIGGLVVCFSGSADSQTAADTKILTGTSEATGAMSFAFAAAVRDGHTDTWEEIMGYTMNLLRTENRFRQVPQFCANRRFALDTPLEI